MAVVLFDEAIGAQRCAAFANDPNVLGDRYKVITIT
jgi:hypothetical protein